jgi:mycothiol synthase
VPAALTSPAALDLLTAAQVRSLAQAIEGRDGQPPLSDRALSHLTTEAVDHLVVRDSGVGRDSEVVKEVELIGYGQREGANAEVLGTVEGAAAVLDGWDGEIGSVWSHGTRSFLVPLLSERGFSPTRVLHQLRRSGSQPVDPVELPPGVRIDAFRPGLDEPDWLRVNAAAFAHHPEQGHVQLSDLLALEGESWFDPNGFLLAHRGDDLLGYHWTKVHADGVGEVYVIGVDPVAQGMGLGRILLDAGLRYLATAGCPEVLLYVDDSNSSAMRLYESVGFTRYDADTQWSSP